MGIFKKLSEMLGGSGGSAKHRILVVGLDNSVALRPLVARARRAFLLSWK